MEEHIISKQNSEEEKALKLAIIKKAKKEKEVSVENKEPSGSSGYYAVALSSNIAARRNPTLFDTLEEEDKIKITKTDAAYCVDRNNKPVYLTNKDAKLVYTLSYEITKSLATDEELREYIAALNVGVVDGSFPKQPITRLFSVKELTKSYFWGSSRARLKKELIKGLKRLSEIQQVTTFKLNIEGIEKELTKVQPLITIQSTYKDSDPETGIDLDAVEITFSQLFFNRVTERYFIATPKLLDMWGKRGSGTETELFGVLFNDLCSKYYIHHGRALHIKEQMISEHKGKVTEELEEAIAKAQRKELTYIQKTATLRDRILRDYTTTRKVRQDFIEDLQRAIAALIDCKILTKESFITKEKDKIYLVFNLDLGKESEEPEPLLVEP